MVDLSEVEDKLPLGSFTARAKTDGIDIRQTVGLRQAQASGEARTAAMMRSEAGFFPQTFCREGKKVPATLMMRITALFAVPYMLTIPLLWRRGAEKGRDAAWKN